MNKKYVKCISIILLVLFLLLSFSISSYAIDPEDIIAKDNSPSSNKIGNAIGAAINLVRVVSMSVSIIMLVVLALKYMFSAPNDKADIKKHAVVYVVGAIVLFSISGILSIIQIFAIKNIE